MARGKKAAKELSPEEKLQQALVPAEEWPYPIPENWCWTTVDKVATVITGGTPSKKNPEYYGDQFPFFKPTDLDAGRHVIKASEYLSESGKNVARIIPQESTAVCCIGSVGKSGYLEIEGTTNQQINSAIPKFNPLYLFYFMNTDNFVNQLWSKSSATTISIVNKAKMESCYFPLAPLDEQQRIVDRIESLFAKLDEAKEKAQAVVDGFELRKSAILHKAFTGELTERWRKEHGVGLESWTDTTIGEQAELITKGASPRWQGVEYTDDKSQTLFVTSENVREGYLNFTKEKYLSNKINDIQKRSILNYGDVLVNIVGASIGRAAIYNLHQLANTNQAVCIVRLKPGISNEFVCTYLNAPIAQSYYYDNKVETARANISLGSISAMYINLPTSAEQKEIVDTLNMALEMEQQAKEAAEAVLSQIDTMKKAILARAFRGELGTNDPAEESAEELIKAVL